MRPKWSAFLIGALCWMLGAAPGHPATAAAASVTPLAPGGGQTDEVIGNRVDIPDQGLNNGTIDWTANCDPHGTSTIHFHATGLNILMGPYLGLFDYDVDITLGPHTFNSHGEPNTQSARVQAMSATFSVNSPAGKIHGTQIFNGPTLANPTAFGTCGTNSDFGRPLTRQNADAGLSYDVEIDTPNGCVHETGISNLSFNHASDGSDDGSNWSNQFFKFDPYGGGQETIDCPPSTPDPFVRAVDTHLELDGYLFDFTGMNIYNANSDDWCANNMDNGKLEQALTDIGDGGVHGGDHGVIRAWFFEPLATAGLTAQRDWTRFDRTIAAAKAAGYYVIPTLGNQWGECGHKGPTAPYKTIDWYRTGYTQVQPEDSVYGAGYLPYRDWVAQVVDRYKDDPTILAWQLMNEAETNPAYPQGCPPGSEAFNALHDWAADVSTLVKSIDHNHLVSLGTIGSGQCGTSGDQYKALHDLPNVDLCEAHDYDPWNAMPGDVFNGLALRIRQCGELHKPLFIGEVGLRPIDIGGSYDSRASSLRAKLFTQRAAQIVGHLVWNWGPGPRALDAYDIGLGDPVLELLPDGPNFIHSSRDTDGDWVAPFITIDAPNRPLYTKGEAVPTSYSCDDKTGYGVATCHGPQPSGDPLDTSTPGHFTFTVDTTDQVGNHRSASYTYDVTAGDVSTSVQPGPATVTTDPGGAGASAAVPIQTTVQFTAPPGSATPVSIDLHAPNIAAPSGYSILGNEVDVDLGGVTRPANDPIVITFLVDSSTGADPAAITVSRTSSDGSTVVAQPCISPPTANLDPCFTAAFTDGPGSDVRVTVSTTHASKWLVLRPADATPPVVTSSVTGTQGLLGWYRGNVTVSWTTTDAQSAIMSSTGCSTSTVATDTTGRTFTCSATSSGGTTTKSVSVKRDATPPTLTCTGGPFVLNDKNARVGVTITDATSGPVVSSVFLPADTSTAGRRTASFAGLDKAGNTATTNCSYLVGYSLTNVKPAAGAIVKRGSTIGVEFKLKDAAGKVLSDNAAKAIANACGAKILFSAGNPSPNCARYDASSDTFLFDLKTSKTMTPARYVVTIQVLAGADVVNTATVTVDIRT